MSKRKPGPSLYKNYRVPTRYEITFAALADHIPDAPERTAYKAKDWDYLFQVWPNEPALRTTIKMQERRGSKADNWTAWIDSPMGQRYLTGLFTMRPDAPMGWMHMSWPGSPDDMRWRCSVSGISCSPWFTDRDIVTYLRDPDGPDIERVVLVRDAFVLIGGGQ